MSQPSIEIDYNLFINETKTNDVKQSNFMKKKMFVYCSFQKEGYHVFPEAKTDPVFNTNDFLNVSHLANRHMHYFFFKVWVEVNHSNREIEFIQLRRWLEYSLGSGTIDVNNKSCEMLAEDVINLIHDRYPLSEIRVDVSEEGINGSYLEFCPL